MSDQKNEILRGLKSAVSHLSENYIRVQFILKLKVYGFLESFNKFSSLKVVCVLVSIFVLLPLVIPIGRRVANDFPFISSDFLKLGFSLPQTWTFTSAEGLGEYSVATLWSWPFNLLFGILGRLGFNFQAVEYITLITPIFILGVFSIDKFLSYFKIKTAGRIAGGLLYLANTYFLLLVDGGQLSIALEYALFPLVFVVVAESIRANFKKKVVAALLIAILGTLEPRILLFLFALLGFNVVYMVSSEKKERLFLIFSSLATFLVITVIFAFLNSYWLLPAILAKSNIIPQGYVLESKSFLTLKNAFAVFQPHWYKNVFGKVANVPFSFYVIPLLAFLAPLLDRKNKKLLFWVSVALVSIFFSKGTSPPFGEFYGWLFDNIPPFYLFRDSTKFFFLVNISFAVLIGATVARLQKYFRFSALVVGTFLILLIAPVYTGKMTGVFSEPVFREEYTYLHREMENDREFGRVLWLPSRTPLSFADSLHTSLEALRIIRWRPFAIGLVGKYELFNFIREAPFIGQLFDIAGIAYIAYPFPDERRVELKDDERKYFYAFSDQIDELPWMEKKISDFPISLFKTKSSQDRFFIAPNTLYIIGSDRIYWDLIKISGFELSKNALVFAEEFPEIIKNISNYAKVVLFEKDSIDLAVGFLSKDRFIFPAEELSASPSTSLRTMNWWKRDTPDLIWWRDFLQQKYKIDNLDFDYGGGNAIAEGNRELQISNDKLQMGDEFLARVMTSSKGGKIEFWQGDAQIGEIDTKIKTQKKVQVKLTGYKDNPDQIFEYDKADFIWFKVGELAGDGEIMIKTSGEINVVNSLLAVSKGEWEEAGAEVGRWKSEGRIYFWDELDMLARSDLVRSSHNNPSITYESFSPTHYKIKVSSLDSPATLVFSETFDSLWTLDGKHSTKIYSLVNGFSVENDGEYDVYFEPQKYVLPGLLVSVITFVVLVGYFLIARFKPS